LARLGNYELESEIGRGGFGRVFRARHVPTGALRALKVLQGVADPEVVARFRRESEALARVGPLVAVPVHETGSFAGGTFYAMDLMPGGSLATRFPATARLPWREAVALIARLARLVEQCHSAGLVHRDLKPANILFDEQGQPKLVDFGCARDLGAATLTSTGTSLGTPGYMAPEQLDGKRGDERSDVYALGVMLHELVTGSRPHAGQSWRELLIQAQRGLPAPVAPSAGAPRELDRILGRTLAFDPSQRMDSAAALTAELEALTSQPARSRSRTALLGVGIVVVVSLGALILRAGSSGVESAPTPPSRPAPANLAPAKPVPGTRSSDGEARDLDFIRDASRLAHEGRVLPRELVRRAREREPQSGDLAILEAIATLSSSQDPGERSDALQRLAVPGIGRPVEQLRKAAATTARIHEQARHRREEMVEVRSDPIDPKLLSDALRGLREDLIPAAVAELAPDCRADLVASESPMKPTPIREPIVAAMPQLLPVLEHVAPEVTLAVLTFPYPEQVWITSQHSRLARLTEETGRALAASDRVLAGHAFALATERYAQEFIDDARHAEALLEPVTRGTGLEAHFAVMRLHPVEVLLSDHYFAEWSKAPDGSEHSRTLDLALDGARKAHELERRRSELHAMGSDFDDREELNVQQDARRYVGYLLLTGDERRARDVTGLDPGDPFVFLRQDPVPETELEAALKAALAAMADGKKLDIDLVRSVLIVDAVLRRRRKDEDGARIDDAQLAKLGAKVFDRVVRRAAELRLPAR
jgi:serine/threonine-protein kinase